MPRSAAIAEDVPPLADLVALCHHRWAVPVVGQLGRAGGAKFITLVNRLGVSRDALSRTLGHLDALDLAMRNPGYGHPMRPEWILTPQGEGCAGACVRVVDASVRAGEGAADAAGLKWSLPILACLHGRLARFGNLREALPGVTPRALAMTLGWLEGAGLVERRVEPGPPAGVRYRLAPAGRALAREAAGLAQVMAGEVG
jgi:DNA-binding HxlR family transcriptional regulator